MKKKARQTPFKKRFRPINNKFSNPIEVLPQNIQKTVKQVKL